MQVRIAESLTNDPRFKELVRTIGDDIDTISPAEAQQMAIGKCWEAYLIATRYWRDGRRLIPTAIWKLRSNASFADLMLAVGLAEVRDDGVYVCGAKDFFDWYHSKREAGRMGGQKSGKVRKEKAELKTTIEANEAEQRSKPSRVSKQRTCSVSVPVSVSIPATTSDVPMLTASKVAVPPPGSAVWEAYAGAYLGRYGVAPVRNVRANSMCSQLVKRLGIDAAIGVVRFYVGHHGAFYAVKSHALGACLHDCESLHTQMLNGKTVTTATAGVKERQQSNMEAARGALEILEGRNER